MPSFESPLGSRCDLYIDKLLRLSSDPSNGIIEIAGGGSAFGKGFLLNLCYFMLHGILYRSGDIAQDAVEFIFFDFLRHLLQLRLEFLQSLDFHAECRLCHRSAVYVRGVDTWYC